MNGFTHPVLCRKSAVLRRGNCLWLCVVMAVVGGCEETRDNGRIRAPQSQSTASDESGVSANVGATRNAPATQMHVGLKPQIDLKEIDDPTRDGWTTEAVAEEAKLQLKRIGKLINSRKLHELEDLTLKGGKCEPLRPRVLTRVNVDRDIQVYRASHASDPRETTSLSAAATSLVESLGNDAIDFTVKVVDVKVTDEGFATSALIQTAGADASKALVEQHALWRVDWVRNSQNLLITRLRVEKYEEVRSPDRRDRLFADCTTAVLGNNESYRRQMLYGQSYWQRRMGAQLRIRLNAYRGIAIGDVDGDGLDDVYSCQPQGLPNRLFLQQHSGVVQDVTSTSGVGFLDHALSALMLDIDNDGDQDLAVAFSGRLVILENDGRAGFSPREEVEIPDSLQSMAAADFDTDGDLDIYIACYFPHDSAAPMPYFDARNGGRNVLLRNDGEFEFNDATDAVGLDDGNDRWSFAASWEDYDNDGDLDLYVSNDFGRNNLYRHDPEGFVDVAETAGVEDMNTGMSVSWSDYDNDGLMDMYISNMFSAAGNRVLPQVQFKPTLDKSVRDRYLHAARGNTLFRNLGNGEFEDVSVDAGVTMGRWAWGANFVDVNNDGFDDIFVANGYITNERDDDL